MADRARARLTSTCTFKSALMALLLCPALALGEDEDMGRRLQEALRAQHGEVHGCYAESLARDSKAAGELLFRLIMGPGGRVAKAEVLKDQSSAPGLAECLLHRMGAWTLPQLKAAPGDQVVFPLVFRPEQQEPAKVRSPRKKGSR